MFAGCKYSPRDPKKHAQARELRRKGRAYKRIATELGLSPATVHRWTKDIELTRAQAAAIEVEAAERWRELVHQRSVVWAEQCRERRRGWQDEGRQRARLQEPLHTAGCMLYWAEGDKARNNLRLANSDVSMLVFFARFLRTCFEREADDFTVSLNVYLGNGLSIHQIESHWLDALELPRECLRKHQLNHMPTSSSGRKKNKLPYGVCSLTVKRSTPLLQHIYGAIQEYAGFDEPRWLDGLY
jgi:hypothetical protein